MTDASPPSASRFLRICLVLFVAASAIYGASPPVADNDLWGHVYFGRSILAAGGLPATNQYSYTAPDYPWINHEILAECIFALTFDHFGGTGLLIMKLLIGAATAALIARVAAQRAGDPLCWAVAVVACLLTMSWGYLIRPQLFTFLGLALVRERIAEHERTGSYSALAVLPLVFVAWINTHGGVAAGVGILGIYLTAALLRTPNGFERARLIAVGVLAVIGLVLNPYGVRLPLFLVEDLSRSRAISEWMPIALLDSGHIIFKLIVASLLVGLFVNRRSRAWEIVVVAITAVLTIRHQRHLPIFAILAAPLLAETFESFARKARELGAPPLTAVSQVLLGVGVVALSLFESSRVLAIYRELHWQVFVSPEVFPVDAVRFIERNGLSGNLLLPFDWGEYAIWHLYPRCRVSVDGRYTTAYPDAVLEASNRFDLGSPGWEAALDTASIALVSRSQPIARSMFDRNDWSYVYSDPTALVFVRSSVAGPRAFDRRPYGDDARAMAFP